MKSRLTAILAGVLLLTALSDALADPAAAPEIRGVGLNRCSAWTQVLRLSDDPSNPGFTRLIFVSWVLGYATAYERANPPIRLDNDQLNSALDASCAAHPDETVLTAVTAVIATASPSPHAG
jgi:hypothetical protein